MGYGVGAPLIPNPIPLQSPPTPARGWVIPLRLRAGAGVHRPPAGAVPPGGWGCGALMAEARSRQGNGEVRTRRVFWCPVSVVQPTAKRTAPIVPPLDRGQGHPQAAPAGQFRQVDCLGRPAVCGWRREGSLGQMPAERPPSLGVTPCCAGLECAAQACPEPIVSDRVAGAVQVS